MKLILTGICSSLLLFHAGAVFADSHKHHHHHHHHYHSGGVVHDTVHGAGNIVEDAGKTTENVVHDIFG